MALLDSIKEAAVDDICDWKMSSFFCAGYKFKLGIAREGATFVAGIKLEGSALDFVQLSANLDTLGLEGVGASVELDEGTKISAKCRWRIQWAGRSELVQSMPVTGPVQHTYILFKEFPGIGPLGSGSVLSECLKEAGYVWDGHLHLTAELVLGMGLAKCGR